MSLPMVPSMDCNKGLEKGLRIGLNMDNTTGNSTGNEMGVRMVPLMGITMGFATGAAMGNRTELNVGLRMEHQIGRRWNMSSALSSIWSTVGEAHEPAQAPPPEPVDHAEDLLTWLQGQALFVGCWVPSKLLEERLYPCLAKKMGWTPYAWRTIAAEFAALDGVARRQDDRRRGNRRIGPTPVVYYIPFPNRGSSVADQTAAVVVSPRRSTNG